MFLFQSIQKSSESSGLNAATSKKDAELCKKAADLVSNSNSGRTVNTSTVAYIGITDYPKNSLVTFYSRDKTPLFSAEVTNNSTKQVEPPKGGQTNERLYEPKLMATTTNPAGSGEVVAIPAASISFETGDVPRTEIGQNKEKDAMGAYGNSLLCTHNTFVNPYKDEKGILAPSGPYGRKISEDPISTLASISRDIQNAIKSGTEANLTHYNVVVDLGNSSIRALCGDVNEIPRTLLTDNNNNKKLETEYFDKKDGTLLSKSGSRVGGWTFRANNSKGKPLHQNYRGSALPEEVGVQAKTTIILSDRGEVCFQSVPRMLNGSDEIHSTSNLDRTISNIQNQFRDENMVKVTEVTLASVELIHGGSSTLVPLKRRQPSDDNGFVPELPKGFSFETVSFNLSDLQKNVQEYNNLHPDKPVTIDFTLYTSDFKNIEVASAQFKKMSDASGGAIRCSAPLGADPAQNDFSKRIIENSKAEVFLAPVKQDGGVFNN